VRVELSRLRSVDIEGELVPKSDNALQVFCAAMRDDGQVGQNASQMQHPRCPRFRIADF